MNRDPIVDEIRRARQQMLAECGGDLKQLLDRLKAAEVHDRIRVVSWKPRHLQSPQAGRPDKG